MIRVFTVGPLSNPTTYRFIHDAMLAGKKVSINDVEVWTDWGMPVTFLDGGTFLWDSHDGMHRAETGSRITIEAR